MEWVTKTTVRSPMTRESSRLRSSRVIASSAPKGSSISRIWGSQSSARQIAARWRWPPESSQGWRSAQEPMPKRSSSARARSFSARPFSPRRDWPWNSAPMSTLSRMVRQSSSTSRWKTMPMSRGGPSSP
jgi:hypothetical protein